MKRKLGIFLPPRQSDQFLLNRDRTTVGILPAEFVNACMDELQKREDIDLIPDLNFRNAMVVDGKVFCGDVCLNDLDRFFWYCELKNRPGSFDVRVLQTLARETEVVCNPHTFDICLDKYCAHLLLKDAGVRVPECVLFNYKVPAKMNDVLDDWGSALLKPRRGGWGKGITLIETMAQLKDTVDYVWSTTGDSPDHGFFLERYYPNDPDKWVSTTMINGKLALPYKKIPSKFKRIGADAWKVKDQEEKGGGVVLAEIQAEQSELAWRAYEALGLQIVGFDMIWTAQGPMIVDENTYPGNYPELYRQMNTKLEDYIVPLILGDL